MRISTLMQYDTIAIQLFRLVNVGRLNLCIEHNTKCETGQDLRAVCGQATEEQQNVMS
jgi:hypothetical protein